MTSSVTERIAPSVPTSKHAGTTSALPWVEKYRPTSLSQIVHHEMIIHLLREFIRSREMPHLLFYGPPGTGKTSTILSCAQEIYGKHISTMVLHLNASDERGIDVVRKQIIQFASTANFFCTDRTLSKLVILDEADSMTHAAQLALRDIMMTQETLFCLIGNYQYALLPPLQSRVVRLLFTPIPKSDAIDLGLQVLRKEGYSNVSHDDLVPVYVQAGGDMRQFLNVLQAIAMRGENHMNFNDNNNSSNSNNGDGIENDTETTESKFSHTNLTHVLCQWDQKEVEQFMDTLQTGSLRTCYEMLHRSIIDTHAHTLGAWIGRITDELIKKASQNNSSGTTNIPIERTLDLCTSLANIEHHASFTLNPEVQLFAFVGCCHAYYATK